MGCGKARFCVGSVGLGILEQRMAEYMVNPRGGCSPSGLVIPDGIYGKSWRVGLDLGPSDSMWIAVNPKRLGEMKIPHGVGGEIWWHPCFFLPSDLVEIMVKSIITFLLCWPSHPRWIVV